MHSAGSLSSELRRKQQAGGYASKAAQQACTVRREAARPTVKLDPDGPLWPLVAHMLGWCWSPQQIARTLKRMWSQDSELHVSHETAHSTIYAHPKGELRRLCWHACTKAAAPAGRALRGRAGAAQIPEMVSIHVRPPEVADRLVPGHSGGRPQFLSRRAGGAHNAFGGAGAHAGRNRRVGPCRLHRQLAPDRCTAAPDADLRLLAPIQY